MTDLTPSGSAPSQEQRRKPRSSKVIVVLPTYNEEQNLGALLERIDDALAEEHLRYEVIVVDDGSTDGTFDVAERYRGPVPLSIYRHNVNQGLGATTRDGLYIASRASEDNDIVITMDADETHTPGLILRMIRMIREGHDVVIASRYQPGARVYGLTLFRRIVSYWASLLVRILFPTSGVRDFTCGYRAYRAGILRQAIATYGEKFVEAEGFQCMLDILLKLRELHVVFGEVPLILRYDLKRGKSKIQIGKTMLQSLALLARRRIEAWQRSLATSHVQRK